MTSSPRSLLLISLGVAGAGFGLLIGALSVIRVPAVWFQAFLLGSVLVMALVVGLVQGVTLPLHAGQRWRWVALSITGWLLSLLMMKIGERPLQHVTLSWAISSVHGYTIPTSVLISGLLCGSILGIGQSMILCLTPHLARKWFGATLCTYTLVWLFAGIRSWVV
jgi:hypothetical protein